MTDETVESMKQHYVDVLREIIDDADTLHTTIPASKMTRAVMREQQRECCEQIKHLVTFLSQVYAQVQEIKIEP